MSKQPILSAKDIEIQFSLRGKTLKRVEIEEEIAENA